MANFTSDNKQSKLDVVKDKIVGSAKSALGGATGNEKMKVEGQNQQQMAVAEEEVRRQGKHHHEHHRGNDNVVGMGSSAPMQHQGGQGGLGGKEKLQQAEGMGKQAVGKMEAAAGHALHNDQMKHSGERTHMEGTAKTDQATMMGQQQQPPMASQQGQEQHHAGPQQYPPQQPSQNQYPPQSSF
ncbi:hypothetical protein LPJ63_002895 [Coemansia sp. RSA 2711]|nr:hypothetical protein LPJ63_002895 [Coemansia sp. RSA 2711]